MLIREAQVADILQMREVRLSVHENQLSRPDVISPADYIDYLTRRGKGWVAEAPGRIVGFAVADLVDCNIWALFVRPDYEGRGVGRALHATMLDWYFGQTQETVWLGTAPGTRAETFYRRTGWRQTGLRANGEVGFEMTAQDWQRPAKA